MADSELTRRAREVLAGLSERGRQRVIDAPDFPDCASYTGGQIRLLYRLQSLGLVRVQRDFAFGGAKAHRLPLGREVARLIAEGTGGER